MGQSTSSTASSSSSSNGKSKRFLSPPSSNPSDVAEEIGCGGGGGDHTQDIPDECLAYVFQFLGAGDRKRCSLVCRRWWRVDGQSRCRLSVNAQSEIVSAIPSLFTRFDAVTKLALRCDRKSISLDDDALAMISIRCRSITRLKLRGCREVTDGGMASLAANCKGLKKLSVGSCAFGAKGVSAVLDRCADLEELSIKRLRSLHVLDGEPIGPGAAAHSLKSICLKELINGQCFEPLVTGCKKLKTLKIIRCLGDWDKVLETIGNGCGSQNLTEVHLERLQVTDVGLTAVSKCVNVENLHIVKTPECSNSGLVCVAGNCRKLRKLHIDGWRTNRIGDDGLIAVAKQCPNLQELVLIGVNATHLSLTAVAASCQRLERLALCGSGTIGDTEIACIAAKCVALKKLCIKGCGISDAGIEALACGCPNLVKVKVRKCRGVSSGVVDWLQERKASLVVNFDDASEVEVFDAISESGLQDGGLEDPVVDGQAAVEGGSSSSSSAGRLALFRTKLGLFASRNFVACAFSRLARRGG